MMGIISSLRDAEGRAIVTVPLAMREALRTLDDLVRLHGMQFEILCENCHRRHPDHPNRWTVIAEHGGGDGGLVGLVCHCTRRKFVSAF